MHPAGCWAGPAGPADVLAKQADYGKGLCTFSPEQ